MLAPRENLKLIGHQQARDSFLKSFHFERFPHAWIIGGPYGIGKATFAFHMARYLLSGRQDGNTGFTPHDSLHRRIVAQSHGDLWTLEAEEGREIGIESVRELINLLNQTPVEGGWRVVIIEDADKLNRNAANALLKRLEEPPSKTLFFLTTAFPGRLLPTVRSRCQHLPLNPLSEEEVKEVLLSQGLSLPDFLPLTEGSPGRLMRLMKEGGAQIYEDLQKILRGESAASFIHRYGGEESSYALIEDLLRSYLYQELVGKIEGRASFFERWSLENTLKLYEKIEGFFDQCRFAQLDKKTTLLCIFANFERKNTPCA